MFACFCGLYTPSSVVSTQARIESFLRGNPDYRPVVERALAYEDEHHSDQYYTGWSWGDVQAMAPRLVKLVTEGIIRIRYRSRRYTNYELADRETTRRALTA